MENNQKDDKDQNLTDNEHNEESNDMLKKIDSPINSFINNNSGSYNMNQFSIFDQHGSINDDGEAKFNTMHLPQYNLENLHSSISTNNIEQNEPPKKQIPSIFNFLKESYPVLPTTSIFNKPAPYVGLINQGSTCYMNSILQALFHLPAFRRLVFEIDDQNISKPDSENIPLNLKLLFARMQLHKDNNPVSTEDLTTSFGWKEPQTFMQHDVQEFSRVLLENLEEKMKGTELEKSINYIFGGNYVTYIYTYSKSKEIENEKFINNEFYDVSLDVSLNEQAVPLIDDIYSAFDKYTEEEKLTGENQYQSEESTMKDAFIRNKFIKMPRVLYLHLKRFQIDIATNQSIKINSFFRFYKSINLTKYVADEILQSTESNYADMEGNTEDFESDKYQYNLFGILVHSGTSMSGHYMAYLKPKMEDKWYQFNDSFVKEVDEETAINENFGGIDKTSSAYMLIYIKQTDEKNLFHEFENEAIPKEIIDRIKKENDNSHAKHSNLTTNNSNSQSSNSDDDKKVIFYLFTEENTVKKNAFSGKLSFACDREYATQLPMYKTSTIKSLYKNVADFFQKNESQIELWPQFLNEGLIDKLESSSFKDLTQYPRSINAFVFIKENDLDFNDNSFMSNSNFSTDDIFDTNSGIFSNISFNSILNGNLENTSSTLPIFVFTYCSLSKNPFNFIFSYEVDSSSSILNFMANALHKKLKRSNSEDLQSIEIDYIKSIMTIYIKKSNNILEQIDKNEETKFLSYIKNDDIFKSAIFVIELDEWSQFEVPQIENDSYAMDVYLSQKKQENSDNNSLMRYNYLDYAKIFNQKEMNAQQYYNYINDLNKVKIISFGKKIEVSFPNLISISDFKTFLKSIFEEDIKTMIHENAEDDSSINYDELIKSTEILIYKNNEVSSILSKNPNEFKENDSMLTILLPTDKKLTVKFIDPSLLLIDETILSFLLLKIFISYDSFIVTDKTEEFIQNDSTISDLISLMNEKFFSKNNNSNDDDDDEYEIRALQLDAKGLKILRIIHPSENTSSLMNPIRIEKVKKSQIKDAKSFVKVSFEKKLKFDPFLIVVKKETKLEDVKEIIFENAKNQKQIKKSVIEDDDEDKKEDEFVFSFYNEKGEKISNLSNDTAIVDFESQLTEIFIECRKSVKLVDRSVHLYN